MPHKFWFLIATTPWWMYLLFLSLLRLTYLMTKPRIIEMKPYYLSFCSLFLFLGITCYVLPPNEKALLYALPLFFIGIIMAMLSNKIRKVKAIETQKKLFLPGSWWALLIILSFFIGRQILYYQVSNFDWVAWVQSHGPSILLPLYSFSIGMSLTQILYFKRILTKGPYVSENELGKLKPSFS